MPPQNEKMQRAKAAAPPKEGLVLEHVHGFRGHDTRQALYYTASGKMVWFTAAVGIVYDKSTHLQSFFMGHDDDILCMAMHPNNTLVATGQICARGSTPKVFIWDTEDCSCKGEMTDLPKPGGVAALVFSHSGNRLTTVSMDNDHTISVWDWQKAKKLNEAKGGPKHVLAVAANKTNDDQFFSVGDRHAKAWSASGKSLKGSGKWDKFGKNQCTLLTVAEHRGGYITGGMKGQIFTWDKDGRCQSMVKGHQGKGPCYALFSCDKGVVSGGKQEVILYDISLKETNRWNIPGECVTSVCLGSKGVSVMQILVGTSEGSVYEINAEKSDSVPLAINIGHGGMKKSNSAYSGELWGLSMHPTGQLYATVGDDKKLRIFNVEGRKCVASSPHGLLDESARAVCWHPSGLKLAVAQRDGKVKIITYDGKESLKQEAQMHFRKFTNEKNMGIDELRFNPKGDLLATGAHSEGKGGHGGIIDIIKTDSPNASEWRLQSELVGHTSWVNHLDWDVTGNFIHSTDGNPELLYWDVSDKNAKKIERLPAGKTSLQDTEWASWSLHVGWPVQGIIRKMPGQVKQMDMTDANMVDIDGDKKLIAVGDDDGQVVLYNYPCTRKDDGMKVYGGHSSHVCNVKFTTDKDVKEKRLISVGGHDLSVFQWRVEEDAE